MTRGSDLFWGGAPDRPFTFRPLPGRTREMVRATNWAGARRVNCFSASSVQPTGRNAAMTTPGKLVNLAALAIATASSGCLYQREVVRDPPPPVAQSAPPPPGAEAPPPADDD